MTIVITASTRVRYNFRLNTHKIVTLKKTNKQLRSIYITGTQLKIIG